MKFALAMLAAGLALSAATGVAQAQSSPKARTAAFARLPNWSGLWAQFDIGISGSPDDPKENQAFHDSMREHPPYVPAWEAKYPLGAHLRAGEDMPVCTIGFPPMMIGSPMMFQAVITPEETVLIFSLRNEVRQIQTDGLGHTSSDLLLATAFGDSIGHWEGQTLVVDTIASNSPANLVGEPLSDQAHYVERIRLINKTVLQDDMTITDPVALARPWRLTRLYRRVPNLTRIIPEDCEGNDRNPIVNGHFTVAQPAH